MYRRSGDNSPTQVTATVAHYHPFAREDISAMHISMHKHVYTDKHMNNPWIADSNCCLCAFRVERESEEWSHKEFQISKAIFHFPPCERV